MIPMYSALFFHYIVNNINLQYTHFEEICITPIAPSILLISRLHSCGVTRDNAREVLINPGFQNTCHSHSIYYFQVQQICECFSSILK